MMPTTQEVVNRLRPLFQQAVQNRTGVSYLLSEAEASVFGSEDLEALKRETGYPAGDLFVTLSLSANPTEQGHAGHYSMNTRATEALPEVHICALSWNDEGNPTILTANSLDALHQMLTERLCEEKSFPTLVKAALENLDEEMGDDEESVEMKAEFLRVLKGEPDARVTEAMLVGLSNYAFDEFCELLQGFSFQTHIVGLQSN